MPGPLPCSPVLVFGTGLYQLTSWHCHLPSLGSQATDKAFLRLSPTGEVGQPGGREPPGSLWPEQAQWMLGALALATLALTVPALPFFLWRYFEKLGVAPWSSKPRDPRVRVSEGGPWDQAGGHLALDRSPVRCSPGTRRKTPPLGRWAPRRVLSLAIAWPQIWGSVGVSSAAGQLRSASTAGAGNV